MKLLLVVGTRPNIIKIAALYNALRQRRNVDLKLVHTGQHYDARMSELLFAQFDLLQPDYCLNTTPGSITRQTADIMARFEPVLTTEQPDWVVVVGDVTSTLACALVAVRLGIRIAHVEAGLRSGDRQMPEEINRMLTDQIADALFVTEESGVENLRRAGVPAAKIHFVGNVLIDALQLIRPKASALNTVRELGLTQGRYVLMTMHRPANVDTEAGLRAILQIVSDTARHRTVVFPLHPRTRDRLLRSNLLDQISQMPNVRLLEPQGYLEFLNLLEHAAIVITDSGGVQEETTYLRVPCLTFRSTTERPVTVTLGTNQLLSDLNPATVRLKVAEILSGRIKAGSMPPLWDGQTAGRIAEVLIGTPSQACSGQHRYDPSSELLC